MIDYGPFQIVSSQKVGLESEESYIVVRGQVSYLRVLGREPLWEVMTATASEDDRTFTVCSERSRLIGTAIKLCGELQFRGLQKKDVVGRDYVKICAIRRDDKREPLDELAEIANRYFELFDEAGSHDLNEDKGGGSSAATDMQELYDAISSSNKGEDVYLTDGVWLASDGSIHDRGR